MRRCFALFSGIEDRAEVEWLCLCHVPRFLLTYQCIWYLFCRHCGRGDFCGVQLVSCFALLHVCAATGLQVFCSAWSIGFFCVGFVGFFHVPWMVQVNAIVVVGASERAAWMLTFPVPHKPSSWHRAGNERHFCILVAAWHRQGMFVFGIVLRHGEGGSCIKL